MCNDFWAYEDRPPSLQKRSVVGRHTLNELSGLKRDIAEERNKRNLGEDVFTRDSKVPKTKYKKMTDDSKKRFHPARWNRQPLVPPSVYFKYIPKKRNAIVRNFPTEHYGVSGQISETTNGHLHNRSVKVTLDSFCKASYKPVRAGKSWQVPRRIPAHGGHRQLLRHAPRHLAQRLHRISHPEGALRSPMGRHRWTNRQVKIYFF
jgi:hypothetical protein